MWHMRAHIFTTEIQPMLFQYQGMILNTDLHFYTFHLNSPKWLRNGFLQKLKW